MNDEVPRRDAVVIIAVTAVLVALIVLLFAHPPDSSRPATEMEREPAALSLSGE